MVTNPLLFYGSAIGAGIAIAIVLPLLTGTTFGQRCNTIYPNISDTGFNQCVNHLVNGGDIQQFSMEKINNDCKQ